MGFIGGLFSGSKGVEWEPQYAASPEQAQQQYNQTQQQLANQAQFMQALQQQSPYAIQQQMELGRQLAAATRGTGPSVAQAQLAQATGQNVQQQAALMAGQRGASANVGQLGSNIAQMGGQMQQRAAADAATLRAQEQLAARQQLAGLTGQQLGQIAGAQQLGVQGSLQQQQNILNAIAQANQTRGGVAQQTAAGQGRIVGGIFEGLAGLGGKAAGGAAGGEVGKDFANYADGGGVGTNAYWSRLQQDLGSMAPQVSVDASGMGQAGKAIGSSLRGLMAPSSKVTGQTQGGYGGANLGLDTLMPAPVNPMATSQNIAGFKPGFAEGGNVPAMVSPGEKYLPPSEVKKVAEGKKHPLEAGETIPGKAKVKGDSYENDTVKRTLKEGGIVIPRSVIQSDNPAEKAREFVNAILARKQTKRK